MTLLAVLSNWLRVLLILAIGYLTHMRSALATRGHVALGWVVFACALLLFVWAAGRWGVSPRRMHPPTGQPLALSSGRADIGGVLPGDTARSPAHCSPFRRWCT